MPETIATTILAATGPIASVATVATVVQGVIVVASLVYSRQQQRKAMRDYNDGLQDNMQPVRASDAARTIVYGRTRVSGPIAYHATYGDNRERVSHLIAIAGHEIAGVDDVWFNDTSIGVLPSAPGGLVASDSAYFDAAINRRTHYYTAGGVSTQEQLPLDGADFVALDTVVTKEPETFDPEGTRISGGQEVVLVLDVDYSYGGGYITMLTAKYSGAYVCVTYGVKTGIGLAGVYYFLGTAAGERDTLLESWSGGEWPASAIGCNIARLHIITAYHPTMYATGFPAVSAVIRGKKVYDPRKDSTNGGSGAHRLATASTWEYSDNPALCAADYLMASLGLSVVSTRIGWPSVITAANVCDELVPLDDPPTQYQKRYTCAGVLSTDVDRKTNLETLLDSMGGICVYSGGLWSIKAGAYSTPSLDLDESDLAGGEITIQAAANKRDLFNAVRGRYRAPDQLYQVTDFPPYESATYAADDGGQVIWREIDLPMVDDPIRAQRIAKMILHRARQSLTVVLNFKLMAYALQPGDTLTLSLDRYGWADKVFRVLRREFIDFSTVRLTLQEDASDVYSWSYDEARDPDPAPNSNLPDPRFVSVLAGVSARSDATTYYVRQDGVVVPYVEVAWTLPTEDDVHVEVFWKRGIATEFDRIVCPVGATFARLEGVGPNDLLNIYAVAVNHIGARSAISWIPAYTVSANSRSANPITTSNMVVNSTFDANGAGLTANATGIAAASVIVLKPTSDNGFTTQHQIPGTPTNIILQIQSVLGGNGYAGIAEFDYVQVAPGRRYSVYLSVIGYATDVFAQIEWYDLGDTRLTFTQTNTVAGVPVNDSANQWYREEDYDLLATTVIAPANARKARIVLYAMGNWTAGTWKYVSIFKPMFGEIPLNVNQLPPWSPGPINSVGNGLVARGAVTQVVNFADPVGMTVNNSTAVFADYTMTTATMESDGTLHVSVTFQVDAAGIGGASTVSVGIYATGKLALISRVVGVASSGGTISQTVTLTADMPVSAGDVISPLLRLSRSRFGLGAGSTVDRISLVSGRLKLHKA